MNYKGKGEHSINELEEIIEELTKEQTPFFCNNCTEFQEDKNSVYSSSYCIKCGEHKIDH